MRTALMVSCFHPQEGLNKTSVVNAFVVNSFVVDPSSSFSMFQYLFSGKRQQRELNVCKHPCCLPNLIQNLLVVTCRAQ